MYFAWLWIVLLGTQKRESFVMVPFLNPAARAWFLKIDPVQIVGICVCVSAPETINDQWHDVA